MYGMWATHEEVFLSAMVNRQVGVYKMRKRGGRKVKRCTAGRGGERARNNDNDGVGELIACSGMVSSAAIFIVKSTYYLQSTIYNLQLFFLSLESPTQLNEQNVI